MKRTLLFAALAAASILGAGAVRAAGFTYHGNLQDAGKPADGKYDIALTLYSAQTGGSVIGGPLTMYAVPVHEGSFSTEADFGPLAKSFSQSYVGVKVRAAGSGNYAALDTRASVTPEVNTSCPGSWSLDGNAGNLAGSYLGTADAVPLDIKVNGVRVGEFSAPDNTMPPNVNLGYSGNTIASGKTGVTIGGGGFPGVSTCGNAGDEACFNSATNNYATISGGRGNVAHGISASVGGGEANGANGNYSTVPGGEDNVANGKYSFASGFFARAIHDKTFVWSDGNPLLSTGANQFDISATGGVAINSTPLNPDVELTIVANGSSVDYANVFMRQRSTPAGILFSSGQATAGNNNAQFFLDQFDGTAQKRLITINRDGIGVGGAPDAGLTIHPTTTMNQSLIELANDGISTWTLDNNTGGGFAMIADTSAHGTTIPLQLDVIGNLEIAGSASKPGGGPWLATSDRRIKQDIAPIIDALDTVMKLRPVNFRYTPEYRALEGGLADKMYQGFVAQEFAEVFPEAVKSTGKRVPGAAESDSPILALDANPALITTVAAVQELAVENSALHKQIDDLEARLTKLEAGTGH